MTNNDDPMALAAMMLAEERMQKPPANGELWEAVANFKSVHVPPGTQAMDTINEILATHKYAPVPAEQGSRELTGLDELKGLEDLQTYFQGSNCGTMYDRSGFQWVPRKLLIEKIQGIIDRHVKSVEHKGGV